jgi:tRNA(Arg) A34 adenosine deaminase TadA
MCTGAALLYGIPRVVVGENRTFLGREDLLAQGASPLRSWTTKRVSS